MALQGFQFSFVTPTPGSTGLVSLGISIPGNPIAFAFMSNGGETSGTFFSSSTRRYHMHSFAVPPGTGSRGLGTGASSIDQYSFGSISHGGSAYGSYYSEEDSVAFVDDFGLFGTIRFASQAHIDSVDDNGDGTFDLTMNWSLNSASNNFQHIIHGLAFYDDAVAPIAGVTLFRWSADTNAGANPVTITDLGVQSDAVWSIGANTATGPTATGPGGKTLMFAMNCALEQASAATAMSNGGGAAVGIRRQETVAAIGMMDETSNWTMDLTTMNSDGWVLQPSTAGVSSSQSFLLASLCFVNVSSAIGAYVKPDTTTGPDTITTPDVNGAVAVFFGVNNVTATGMQNNDRFATGYATSGGSQAKAGSSVRTPSTTPMSGVDYTNRAYAVVNNDTETVQALIDSVSFASGSISPNWLTNDAELTETLYLVLGTGGGGTCAGPSGGSFAGTWVDTQMVPVFA